MRLSPRETLLGLGAFAVVLFGVAGLAAKSKLEERRQILAKTEAVRGRIRDAQALIATSDQSAKQLETLSKMLPVLPADKPTDTYWLSAMDKLAMARGVKINRRQLGEEKKDGEIYELPIECPDFEASLDNLVHFLFDLQAEGAMFDVRQLLIKPREGSLLRGRFTLYCAYRRGVPAGP